MRQILRGALAVLLPVAVLAQEPTLPVPPNVTVDGVPPIPMPTVEAVSPYGQFRRARVVAWHPVERRMLVATAFGNANQIHEVRFPGGARMQLTFAIDGVTQRPPVVFESSGRAFIFQKDTARGGEANQLFRYDFASATVTLLTDGKSRNGAPVLARRSGLIAYDSTRRTGKDRDLYVMNPADPKTDRIVAQMEGSWSVLDWSPDEKSLLALETLSSSQTYLWRVDVADGRKTAITPREGQPVRWAAAQFLPDGRAILAVGNRESEILRLWRHETASGAWSLMTPPEERLEDFALSPDGRTVAVVLDKGAASQLQLLDANGRVRVAPALPPGVIGDLTWHPKGTELALSLHGARTFFDAYSVNASTGRPERWTWSEMGGANPESLPDAELAQWKSFDGLTITGWLYRPPARFTGPRPVIINVHGGPVAHERPRALGRSNYFRNELGIAVIYPNIRGSSGFGRTFEELDNARLRENAVKDIGALLDLIAKDPSLDEKRVMIAGASYGGYIALAAAIEYGDRLRGTNPAFAITDFPSFLESTDMSRQANRNVEYGDPADPSTREFLTRISPLTNVARLKIPVYLAAGARDTRVPIAQAETMVKALKANGTPVWYVRFDNAGHLELTNATNDFSIFTWALFVQKYLLE